MENGEKVKDRFRQRHNRLDWEQRSYEMRRAIFVFIIVGLLSLTSSDVLKANEDIQDQGSKTKIETFLTRKGRLLVKEVYTLGKITGLYSSSCVISGITTYEPGDKKNRLKGLIIEVNEGQSDERTNSSFLDIEEIEGLSTALASMVRLVKERSKTESSYIEIIYTTEDELGFGVYFSEGEEGGFISGGGAGKLTISLEPQQMNEIKKIVGYGYTLLKMK